MAFSSPCRRPEAGRQPRPAPGRDDEIRELVTMALTKLEGGSHATTAKRPPRPAAAAAREADARGARSGGDREGGGGTRGQGLADLSRAASPPGGRGPSGRAIREERNIVPLVAEVLSRSSPRGR